MEEGERTQRGGVDPAISLRARLDPSSLRERGRVMEEDKGGRQRRKTKEKESGGGGRKGKAKGRVLTF